MLRLAIIFYTLLFAANGLRAQKTTLQTSARSTPSATPAPSVTPVPTPTPITTTTLKKLSVLGRMLHPFSSSEVLPKYQDRKLRGLVLNFQVSPQPVRLSEVRQMEVKVIVTNPSSILVNPGEHIEYKEMIATRDLTPGRVFTAEAFFPNYPELRIRQKFM